MQMFVVGAMLHQAAMSADLREALWGPGRATGEGLVAYREAFRANVRAMVVAR
jgi:hypothetical protein